MKEGGKCEMVSNCHFLICNEYREPQEHVEEWIIA